jgi:hypothetical protein
MLLLVALLPLLRGTAEKGLLEQESVVLPLAEGLSEMPLPFSRPALLDQALVASWQPTL